MFSVFSPKQVIYLPISLALLVMIIFTLGCQKTTSKASLPDWVLNPPAGCAMGSLQTSHSLSLAKTGAVSRARDALARSISTRVEGVIKSFLAEGRSAGEEPVKDELYIEHTQQATSASLQGTSERERYLSTDDPETLYVLVCVNREQVMKIFEGVSAIPTHRRDELRVRAQEAFADLEAMMQSYEAE